MGRTLAHRVGADPRFGHDKSSEIVVFEPHQGKDWKVVNVDTTIKSGIIRAKQLGLVQSHTTDLIFTMEPNFAGQELYDVDNKGRFLALFRHPVERAVSMFFYLQTATWERTYRPEWADMTVMEWASLPNNEQDYMVHKLVGKSFGETVDETDLIIAKELVRQRFIVGLMGEMNESIRRFNIVLGVDEGSDRSAQCMKEFGLIDEPKPKEEVPDTKDEGSDSRNLRGESKEEGGEEKTLKAVDKKNSNKHPKVRFCRSWFHPFSALRTFVSERGAYHCLINSQSNANNSQVEEGSPEYEAVASRNRLDMLLYKYIEALFDAQKEIVDSYLEEEDVADEGDASEDPQDDEGPPPAAALSSSAAAPRDDVSASNLALLPPGSAIETIKNDARDILSHLADNTDPIRGRSLETPFFWHVPKSGGTTLQRLYWCMGSTIANEVGVNPKFGKYEGELSDIVAFSPWKDNPGRVVNVDVATHEGILEAKNRGFLKEPRPRVDFISTSEFQFASMMLYGPTHKARMFALFRHPIDREVSKFFYLQKATWEPTYNERWAKMTLDEWASRDRGDNNWMVRKLVGKTPRDDLDYDDLDLAKEIVRTKFVVGLMDKFEESVHRFNYMLGIDQSDPKNQACIEEFSTSTGDAHSNRNKNTIVKKNQFNSYSHPQAERGSDAWVSLAKIHMFDNLLYRYILELFTEQRDLFHSTPRIGSELLGSVE